MRCAQGSLLTPQGGLGPRGVEEGSSYTCRCTCPSFWWLSCATTLDPDAGLGSCTTVGVCLCLLKGKLNFDLHFTQKLSSWFEKHWRGMYTWKTGTIKWSWNNFNNSDIYTDLFIQQTTRAATTTAVIMRTTGIPTPKPIQSCVKSTAMKTNMARHLALSVNASNQNVFNFLNFVFSHWLWYEHLSFVEPTHCL